MTGQAGTFHWMAPETLENKPYAHKADVYSYGVSKQLIHSSKDRALGDYLQRATVQDTQPSRDHVQSHQLQGETEPYPGARGLSERTRGSHGKVLGAEPTQPP